MANIIEPATSSRSRCRGCGQSIPKDELRFGERLPNPFADEGDMTHWFHVACAAHKRPEAVLDVLAETGGLEDVEGLMAVARAGITHRRLPRINGLERAPTGRARCRACRELIGRDAWRIPLVFYEEGMFNPSGFIHLDCAEPYFETNEILDRLQFFGGNLDANDLDEVQRILDL